MSDFERSSKAVRDSVAPKPYGSSIHRFYGKYFGTKNQDFHCHGNSSTKPTGKLYVFEDASHFAQAEDVEEEVKTSERKVSERIQIQKQTKGSERIAELAGAGDCVLDTERNDDDMVKL